MIRRNRTYVNDILDREKRTNTTGLTGSWMAATPQSNQINIGGVKLLEGDYRHDTTGKSSFEYQNSEGLIVIPSGILVCRSYDMKVRESFFTNERNDDAGTPMTTNSWVRAKAIHWKEINKTVQKQFGFIYRDIYNYKNNMSCEIILGRTGFPIYIDKIPEWNLYNKASDTSNKIMNQVRKQFVIFDSMENYSKLPKFL
ncbi:hypothetical protein [Moorena sp. SIO3A2]|uniref:hypothetical protein n=1 Tax=Moorena sp. SIO3A2 TaxID=2607841 RepID=UPI0013B6FB57|nr:hypothetical protein [Moorena sp. SIO3A2]NER90371.1 hypothetical protein [Moorena sp. SIO3A2]